jgi:hypothetical protein
MLHQPREIHFLSPDQLQYTMKPLFLFLAALYLVSFLGTCSNSKQGGTSSYSLMSGRGE